MDVSLSFSQLVSRETEWCSNTYETTLFAHLQICTDNELLIEGAGMTGLDFNDNQAMTLDYVTTKVATPMLLGQEQEPTQRVKLVKEIRK